MKQVENKLQSVIDKSNQIDNIKIYGLQLKFKIYRMQLKQKKFDGFILPNFKSYYKLQTLKQDGIGLRVDRSMGHN